MRATLPAIFMVKYFVSILLVGVGVLSQSAAAELGQAVGLVAVKDPAKLGFDAKKLDAVFAAQKKLIADKQSPSNVGFIVRSGKVVYHRAAVSRMPHDRAIND